MQAHGNSEHTMCWKLEKIARISAESGMASAYVISCSWPSKALVCAPWAELLHAWRKACTFVKLCRHDMLRHVSICT